MKRSLLGAVLVGAILTATLLTGGLVMSQTAAAPVRVKALSVGNRTMEPGSTVPVLLEMHDEELAVRQVSGLLVSPDNLDELPVVFVREKKAGRFAAEVQIPAGAIDGDWRLSQLAAETDVGQTISLDSSLTLRVSGRPSGGVSVQVPKGSFRETQIIPVAVTLPTDMVIGEAAVTLADPGKKLSVQAVRFPSGAQQALSIPVRLQKGFGAGNWQIARISLTGKDGAIYHLQAGRDFDGGLHVIRGRADSLPPSLVRLSLSDSKVLTGSGLAVKAELTDDLSGVAVVTAALRDAAGGVGLPVLLERGDDGLWQATLTIPLYAPAGSWSIQLSARDAAGNEMPVSATDLRVEPGYDKAPTTSLDGVSLHLREGALVATVTPGGPVPVAAGEVRIEPPVASGYRHVVPLQVGSDGLLTGELRLPEHAPSGPWRVTQVRLVDSLGRETVQGVAVQTDVNTQSPDVTPPVLERAEVPAEARSGERIRLVARVHDDLSGVESADMVLSGPGSQRLVVSLFLNEADGSWIGAVTLPRQAAGTWQVEAVRLTDLAWNQVKVTAGPGIGTGIRVR